jgi:two-component system sensor histidine kinase UhpB
LKTFAKYIVLCILYVLCSYPGYGQYAWLDSVKKSSQIQKSDTNKVISFIIISNRSLSFNPDSALYYAQRALLLAEHLHYEAGIFWSEYAVNGALYYLGNYPQELQHCFKALSLAKKMNTEQEIVNAYCMLSDFYYNLGEYNVSLGYMLEVKKMIEHTCPASLSSVWSGLAKIYEGMGNPDLAIWYGKKALNRLSGKESQLDPWQIQRELSGLSWILGHSYAIRKNYDSALYYYRLGIPIARDHLLEVDMIQQNVGIAAVYKAIDQPDSALRYAQGVLNNKISRAYPACRLKALKLLAAMYESGSKPDSALKYIKMAMSTNDSLFSRDKMIAIQNLTFNEQERQKQIESSSLKLQNRYKIFFVVTGFVAFLAAIMVLLRNKRLRQLQLMRNSIADDLHDDIGSTLSSISIMSELAKTKSPQALPLLTSIGESTSSLQENMTDIVWAINPKNDRFENVLIRMDQFASEILEAKNIELDFLSDAALSTFKLSMWQRKNVYLFFKEVINNAAKYSDADKVIVRIVRKEHSIEMTIRDNGKGFDTAKVFNGNGMHTLRKRKAELNADLNITSHVNEGTCVQLTFKTT